MEGGGRLNPSEKQQFEVYHLTHYDKDKYAHQSEISLKTHLLDFTDLYLFV